MPTSNAFLLSLIHDVQAVCVEKFNLAKTTLGPSNAELKAVGPDMDRVFASLRNPDIWSHTMDADSEPIVEQMIVLGSVDATQTATIAGQIRKMLQLLENNVLKPGLESLDATPTTSGMNLQTLDALRLTRQQIGIKLRNFALAGQDLMQDAQFLTLQERQDPLVVTYREKLKTDKIISKQTDVIIIKRMGDMIAAADSSMAFKAQYGRLSDFIQLKLGSTT